MRDLMSDRGPRPVGAKVDTRSAAFAAGIRLHRSILLSLSLIVIGSPVLAQRRAKQAPRRFKVGDAIEYLWVNQWLPGEVLAVEGNRVGIQYDWGGNPRQEIVTADKVRFAWEARAVTPMRTWSDESGQFRVRAAAVGLDLENGRVTLYKSDDTEVTVPIAKLSEGDRGVLKKAAEMTAPTLPPVKRFATSSGSDSRAWITQENLSSVAPDPPPSISSVPMAGTVIPATTGSEEVVGLFPIGGNSGWMLAGTKANQAPGRLLWVSLADQKVRQTQWLPPGEALVAVDASNRQVLTLGQDEKRMMLTLWKADPSVKWVRPRARWASAEDGGASGTSWAALVSADRVLHQWGRHGFVVWDVAAEREVYRIEQESFFGAMPVLSPGKRYLALPEDKRVRMIEAVSGQTLATIPVEGGSSAGVAFDRDGAQLAVLTRSELAIWKLGSEDPPRRLRADAVGTPFAATLEWVDERSLLINRETLFDLELQLPVWAYKQASSEVQRDDSGKRTLSVVDAKLCYVVAIRGQQKGHVVGAVELPGPSVRETVEKVDPEKLYLLKPGTRVKLQVACGSHNPQVQLALAKQIQDNGWVLDAAAPLTLFAEMGRGETQTVQYRAQFGGSRNQSATVTPYFSTVKIMQGETVAWQSGSSSGLPPVMFLQEGETAQSKANAMQKPDPQFFERVEIPEKVFDPRFRDGFGISTISSRGLVPNDGNPPVAAAE